jgi:hypothetical protein
VEGADEDDEPEQDPLASLTECRFVPADPTVLMTLYHALSDGAALNPDSEARRLFLCLCVGEGGRGRDRSNNVNTTTLELFL